MTTLIFTKQNRWQLVALPFKSYVIAVPVVLLLYTVFRPSEAWLFHQNTALDREQARTLSAIVYGYIVSIVALLTCGAFAQLAHDKKAMRSALIFAVLGLVSLLVLYPAVVIPTTR